ncbi:MAG: hypothetical protein DRH12_00360 [Deltaproteobacteria bacterium]|nr:MAG: hypothetical protein DRH12_00360 [Deltaproteobacteria bacterium]RLB86532.1 MAG: hypothetical protein DRH15_01335 [Deltaproteobacteria bacterium]
MKITGIYGPQGEQPSTKLKTGNSGKDEFKKVMEKVLNDNSPGSISSPTVTGPKTASEITAALAPHGLASPVLRASNQIEMVLDTLDFYAHKLGDQSIKPKDIDTLVDDMMTKISALDEFRYKNSLPRALDDIISDLVATVSSEVEKFKRGDYS